jgi:glycosyltransferase involved in cell wall biosynthesis
MSTPTISIIIPTYNSEPTLDLCLKSIQDQDYPKERIEIIIVDGGSKDRTMKIVKKYKARIIHIEPNKQNVEYNKCMGVLASKNKYLLMIDHDNILPNRNILKKMVQPFIDDKSIVGVETYRYFYNKKGTILDRYFALFGVIEPLVFYLGKADRMSYINKGYDAKYNPHDHGDYFEVSFRPGNIPTIGANGFMINKEILFSGVKIDPKSYYPIDINVDLINKGINKYAFIKDSIYHISGHGNVMSYLKRRALFVKQYHLGDNTISPKSSRRYSVYESKDFWKLVYYIVISLTIVIPLIDSIKGYRKIHDSAWFLHPFLSFMFVVIYSYVFLKHIFHIIYNKLF